jgi:hypothetical protein
MKIKMQNEMLLKKFKLQFCMRVAVESDFACFVTLHSQSINKTVMMFINFTQLTHYAQLALTNLFRIRLNTHAELADIIIYISWTLLCWTLCALAYNMCVCASVCLRVWVRVWVQKIKFFLMNVLHFSKEEFIFFFHYCFSHFCLCNADILITILMSLEREISFCDKQ